MHINSEFIRSVEETFTRERMISYWRGLGYNVTNEPQLRTLDTIIRIESERHAMTRGKGKDTNKRTFGVEFLSANMTSEEKSAFREYVLNTEEIAEHMINFVDSGYKLSVGYDKNNDSCYATLTNKDGHKPFIGKALTCHAKSSRIVLTLMIFKHSVLADGDWSYWDNTIEDDFG